MKLARFGTSGRERPALVDAVGRLRDLSDRIADIAGEALLPASLDQLRAIDPETLPLAPADARIGPCVGRVGKFVAISLNYVDHAEEVHQPLPEEPVILLKATSSISGPYDPVVIPRGSSKVDWEVELGIVIGTGGVYIPENEALSHVAGYCIVNDVSARDFQLERGGTWDKGKSSDTFGPIGPWLVTPDEVGDVANLRLWLEVDGHRYQDGTTARMIFSIARIISCVSGFMSLQPGDIITTGTPPGNGLAQDPPVFLKPGQEIQLGIDRLGQQAQRVVQYPA